MLDRLADAMSRHPDDQGDCDEGGQTTKAVTRPLHSPEVCLFHRTEASRLAPDVRVASIAAERGQVLGVVTHRHVHIAGALGR
jgi:hypothetical protein